MVGRKAAEHVADVGGQLRVARCGHIVEFRVFRAVRLPGHPHGFADRDRARPAEQRGRFTQLPDPGEDLDECLLGGVGAVVEGYRSAKPADVGPQDVEKLGHCHGVAALCGPHQAGELVGGGCALRRVDELHLNFSGDPAVN